MNNQAKAYIAITCTTFFWGISFITTKLALETLTVFSYVFSRFLLASLFFLVMLKKRGLPKLDRSIIIKMVALALLQPFGYFLFETLGLKYTSATKASLLIALIPIVVAITARILLKETIRRKTLAGIILSVIGVVLLVTGGKETDLSLAGSLKGDIFILLAILSASLYMVLTKDLGKKLPSFYITAFQIFLGTLFFLPFFIADLPKMTWSEVSMRSVIGVLYNVLGGTIGGFLCYNFSLTHLKASTVAVFANLIPIITALGAWIILGEVLTSLQFLGGAVVIMSVLLTTSAGRRKVLPPS